MRESAAEGFDDAVVGDGLADHSGEASLLNRFILRTQLLLVNGSRDSVVVG